MTGTLPSDFNAILADFAPAYSASSTYAVGDYVFRSGQLYQCNTAIAAAEEWTAAHWTAVTVGGELSELSGEIDSVASAVCDVATNIITTNYDPDWTAGYYQANGNRLDSTGYSYSPKIAVSPGDFVYKVWQSGNTGAIRTVTAYANDVAIEALGKDETSNYFEVPPGINYVRITVSNDPTVRVRVVHTTQTYTHKTDALLILDRTITETSGYINGSGGINSADETQKEVYTNAIKVVDTSVKWSATYGSAHSTWIAYAAYDKNQNFIGRYNLFTGSTTYQYGTITPADGVHYIAFTYRTFGDCTFSATVNPDFDEIIDSTIDTPEIPRNVTRSVIGVNPFRHKPFMSHMYIGATTPPVPNQSIYDIHNSKKLGFDVIEANVQTTSDSKYICYHGSSGKFAGNVHHVDGVTDLTNTAINSVTLEWIQTNVRYNSTYEKYQTAPTTLEDFLYSCRMHQMIPMVTGTDQNVIAIANEIMGKDNYISYGGRRSYTSAPILAFASDATKAAILARCNTYGAPFIYSMGNPTDFTDDELKDIIDEVHENGYLIGMASCYISYEETLRLLSLGFDMSASDFQVNDFSDGNILNLSGDISFSTFATNGTETNNNLVLETGNTVSVPSSTWTNMPTPFFSKSSLRFRANGSVTVTIGGKNISVTSDGTKDIWLSAFYYNQNPNFVITATAQTTIYSLEYHASVV